MKQLLTVFYNIVGYSRFYTTTFIISLYYYIYFIWFVFIIYLFIYTVFIIFMLYFYCFYYFYILCMLEIWRVQVCVYQGL